MTDPTRAALEALDSINQRVNRGIGEGMVGATRWRDALIEVGEMLDDLINSDALAAPAPEPLHPDDGHGHRYACRLCGVDSPSEQVLRNIEVIPASEPDGERIDRWGDKGPCGFVHPGGTPCLIERYKHPNVVAIGHRWRPTKPTPAPEPERCAECGQSRDGLKHRCWTTHFRRVREAGDGLHILPDCHPFREPTPAVPPTSAEALRVKRASLLLLVSGWADDGACRSWPSTDETPEHSADCIRRRAELRRRLDAVIDAAINEGALIGAAARHPWTVDAEALARLFHETYERLAPDFGYETRRESAVPWEQVPDDNRRLMVAVAAHVLAALEQGR